MTRWRNTWWMQTSCLVLAAWMAASCGGGGAGSEGGGPGGSGTGTATSAIGEGGGGEGGAESEIQASFANPVTNTGAFVFSVPFEFPEGINGLTPPLSLGYSSHGGVGIAGVGWDLTLPMIGPNLADGVRPRMLEEDLERFPEGTPVERYTSGFGRIAAIKQADGTNTFTLNPYPDALVKPIRDFEGRDDLGGEPAAWKIKTKDGREYFYGQRDRASLFAEDDLGAPRRKVAWMLNRVEDPYGNTIKYYYEEYPNEQGDYRHPVLRAIEYGIPASNSSTTERLVVWLDYTDSPWKRFSWNLGTRTDYAFLLDRVCLFARAQVNAGTSVFGHHYYYMTGPGSDLEQYCYDLEYYDPSESYTERSLLRSVQRVGPTGSAPLPPWVFSYAQQGGNWSDTYQASASTSGDTITFADHAVLEESGHDVTQAMADVNGDGIIDVIRGDSQAGLLHIDLANGPGLTPTYTRRDVTHPLAAAAEPMFIESVDLNRPWPEDADPDSPSDCWYSFEVDLTYTPESWTGGYGYVRSLTRAHDYYYELFAHATDESEDSPNLRDLGMFQFLRNSFYGANPSLLSNTGPKLIDQLETFGSYKDSEAKEYYSDWRASDCQDWGDHYENDYCWNIGKGRSGTIGEDLSCLDCAGCRWFADSDDEAYSSLLWDFNDLDGDGLPDWQYATNLIARDATGALRDSRQGNDWYWGRGLPVASASDPLWAPLDAWSVPPKQGAKLGLGDVDFVHNTGLLGTSVSQTDSPRRSGASFSIGVGAGVTGWGVSASFSTGGLSLPVAGVGAGYFGGGGIGGSIGGVGTQQSLAGGARDAVVSMAGVGLDAGTSWVAGQGFLNGMELSAASAAARGAISVANGEFPLSHFLPSIGLGVRVTGDGAKPYFYLPVVGDLLDGKGGDLQQSLSSHYQGQLDLNGDGRPDLVSSRYDAGASLNAEGKWLYYRNNGVEFEYPSFWEFEVPPTFYAGNLAHSRGSNYTFDFTAGGGGQDMAFGQQEQESGTVDLNGDGLVDHVISFSHQPVSGQAAWQVSWNTGSGFSAPTLWLFEGDWASTVSDCTFTYHDPSTYPRLMRVVYGGDGINEFFTSNSRQVQGLFDVNQDGLLDYWHEGQGPVSDALDCGYLQSNSYELDELTLEERVDAQTLSRPLYVWLNDGESFVGPVQWVTADVGHSLSGGEYKEDATEEMDRTTKAVVGVGDHDADGQLDVAVSTDDFWSLHDFQLYQIGEATADLMSVVTTPHGGDVAVDYTYHLEPGGVMGRGQWVVSTITMKDFAPGRTENGDGIISRIHYTYERGVYSREHRQFFGFERVYQTTEGEGGYTLSRYYQHKGYEGLLYCREVRKRTSGEATGAARGMAQTHVGEWADTPSGEVRTGYGRAVAVGDPSTMGGSDTLVGRADEDANVDDPTEYETSDGDVVGQESNPYAGPPSATATDDPSEVFEANREAEHQPYTPIDPVGGADSIPGYTYPSEPPRDSSVGDPSTIIPIAPSSAGHDLPLYDTPCEAQVPTPVGTLTVYCDVDDLVDVPLTCGDDDDDGLIVKSEFHVYGDYSGVAGIYTPRLVMESEYLYRADGTDPMITTRTMDYDFYGNIVTEKDYGDASIEGDELVTTSEFATANVTDWIVGLPCHVTVTDAAGVTTYSESWFGYDGAAADSCTMPTTGALTVERRAIDATRIEEDAYTYTTNGMIETHTDPGGRVTTYGYHASFPWYRVSESHTVTNPVLGPLVLTTTTSYHGLDATPWYFGLVASETDAAGGTTSYEYDGQRRLRRVIKPYDTSIEPTEEHVYVDWNGAVAATPRKTRVWRRIDATRSKLTQTSFDGFGRVAVVEETPAPNLMGCSAASGCFARSSELVYDGSGRPVLSRLPHFTPESVVPVIKTEYDLLGRITWARGADGSIATRAFDRETMTATDGEGHVAVTVTDARGRVVRTDEQDGLAVRQTHRRYRLDGKVEEIEDADGNLWTYEYDLLGRQTRSVHPDQGEARTYFDAAGNPALALDGRYAPGSPSSLAVTWRYDELNRPIERIEWRNATANLATLTVTGTQSARTNWDYDVLPQFLPGAAIACVGPLFHGMGRVSRVIQRDRVGTALAVVAMNEYCYDARGRTGYEGHTVDGVTYTFATQYNDGDLPIQVVYPDGDVVTSDYSASGHLIQATNGGGPLLAGALYQASGLPTMRELGPGLIREYSCYEPASTAWRLRRRLSGAFALQVSCGETRPDDIVAAPPGSIYADLSWRFDQDGLLEHRWEEIVDPATGTLVPHAGTYTHDAFHRMTSEVWDGALANYAYDDADNLTELDGTSQCYGASIGCTAGATATGPHQINSTAAGDRFRYDAAGNVSRWVNPAGTYDFVYNARNLVRSVSSGGMLLSRYVYDGLGGRAKKVVNGVITHYAGAGFQVNDVNGFPWTETRYPGIGIKVVSGGVAQQRFTLLDGTSSTIMVIDQTGAVTQQAAYEPYGLRRSSSGGGAYQSDWLLGDKELETGVFASGLEVTDFGPRLYLANVGRWLGPDPKTTDGLNPYAYVRNAPDTYYDPDGQEADGHHVVPQQFWRAGKQNAKPFSDDAIARFHAWRTGPLLGGHNGSNGHPAYSKAVGEMLDQAIASGRFPPPGQWTAQHVDDFVKLIGQSTDGNIVNYMRYVAIHIDEIDYRTAKYLARAWTAARHGGRFLGRWIKPIAAGAALGYLARGEVAEAAVLLSPIPMEIRYVDFSDLARASAEDGPNENEMSDQ